MEGNAHPTQSSKNAGGCLAQGGLAAVIRSPHWRDKRAKQDGRAEGLAAHWITESASASNLSGISRPIAFAVLTFITNSNLVGCSTGRSAGFAPLAILSTFSDSP